MCRFFVENLQKGTPMEMNLPLWPLWLRYMIRFFRIQQSPMTAIGALPQVDQQLGAAG